jgi:phosphoribosylanthranilate isomerase
MSRVRVKICGITRPEDAITAANAGADAIGLVFYSASKRSVSLLEANTIIRELPPFITKVGLFVDASREFIESVLAEVNLDLLQFHGEECQEDCIAYSKPYIKAVKMKEQTNLEEQVKEFDKSAGILLDTYVSGVAGGTGQSFNWDLVSEDINKPLVLAGGLDPDNVYDAIQRVKPYAVDVSGGVESSPGIKDTEKIKKFIQRVRELP